MATIVEDFEDASLNVTIGNAGNAAWSRSQVTVHSGGGLWSFMSGGISDGQTSDAIVAIPVGATTVQFWYLVSTESGFDFLEVIINGAVVLSASGSGSWTQSSVFPLSSPNVLFRYRKDFSTSEGLDAVFIDDLTFATPAVAGIPSFTSRPNRVWRLH